MKQNIEQTLFERYPYVAGDEMIGNIIYTMDQQQDRP